MAKNKLKIKFSINGFDVATRNRDGEWTLFKDKDPDPIKPITENEAKEKATELNSGLSDFLKKQS